VSPLTADASNLCKLVEDALNGVAYPDDRLVQMLVVRKIPR
jgi:Holliday junction resolvase RusA-like endonuclease